MICLYLKARAYKQKLENNIHYTCAFKVIAYWTVFDSDLRLQQVPVFLLCTCRPSLHFYSAKWDRWLGSPP